MSIEAISYSISSVVPNAAFFEPKPRSLARIIWDIFFKIVCGFWRTLGSYFRKVNINELQPEEEQIAAELHVRHLSHPELDAALVDLQCLRYIASSTMDLCSQFLFERYQSNLVLVHLGLESSIFGHSVAVIIDQDNRRIEYFDSLGLTIEDNLTMHVHFYDVFDFKYRQSGTVFVTEEERDISTVMTKFHSIYTNELNATLRLWENTQKHQKDIHNCSLYALDYFERRLKGQTPENIALDSCSFEEMNQARRLLWMGRLINRYAPNMTPIV